MAMLLQAGSVVEALCRRILSCARRRGRTVRDFVIDAAAREIRRDGFEARMARRGPVDLGRSAAQTLEEVRSEREQEIERRLA